MNEVKVMEVIYCTKASAGKGIEHDPFRTVTEIFTKNGDLIVKYDPMIVYSVIDLINFAKFVRNSAENKEVEGLLKDWIIK